MPCACSSTHIAASIATTGKLLMHVLKLEIVAGQTTVSIVFNAGVEGIMIPVVVL